MVSPDVPPTRAIITLDTSRKTVDPVAYILQTLRRDWNSKNTDGAIPKIDFAELTKNVIFHPPQDWIILYTVSEVEDPVTITYGFTNVTITFSIDFFSGAGREHLYRLVEEARRIILSHRTDTFGSPSTSTLTGRQWLKWNIRSQLFDNTTKGMHRRVIDCELKWVFRQVQT